MSNLGRGIARANAKKAYKKQVKGVPRHQRVTFAEFFKNYRNAKAGEVESVVTEVEEDFDIDDLINTISDEDVSVGE